MKQNTYYFDHDYNAQHDPKIEKMICLKGNSAYGVFWRLIERLAQEPIHKLKKEYQVLAYAFHETVDFIKSIVEDFELFSFDETFFWSERLLSHFKDREYYSEQGRIGGLKRVANLKGNPPLKPPLSNKQPPHKEVVKDSVEQNNLFDEPRNFCEPTKTSTDKINAEKKTPEIIHKELLKHNYFKDEHFLDVWNQFCKQRGKKYTENAKNIALKKLFKYELHEAIDAIETSIQSGWSGIFPKKIYKNGNGFKTKADLSQESMERVLKKYDEVNGDIEVERLPTQIGNQ